MTKEEFYATMLDKFDIEYAFDMEFALQHAVDNLGLSQEDAEEIYNEFINNQYEQPMEQCTNDTMYEKTKLVCDIMSVVACAIAEDSANKASEYLRQMLKNERMLNVDEIIEHLRNLVVANHLDK